MGGDVRRRSATFGDVRRRSAAFGDITSVDLILGGDKLGDTITIDASTASIEHDVDLVDCDIKVDTKTFNVMNGKNLTTTGNALGARKICDHSFTFPRFSTSTSVADAVTVECKSELKSKTSDTAMVLSGKNGQSQISFLISADGTVEDQFFKTPAVSGNDNYVAGSKFAILKGIGYLFGSTDNYKIAMLHCCEFVELSVRLNLKVQSHSSILTVVESTKSYILICFGSAPNTDCEIFDGSSASQLGFPSNYDHYSGCLVSYNGTPTAVKSKYSGGNQKIEILGAFSWTEIADHPGVSFAQGCVEVENGFLTLGGKDPSTSEDILDIHLLRNDVWSNVGTLQKGVKGPGVISFGQRILVVGGVDPDGAEVESLEWDGKNVTSSQIIYSLTEASTRPMVFRASSGMCPP